MMFKLQIQDCECNSLTEWVLSRKKLIPVSVQIESLFYDKEIYYKCHFFTPKLSLYDRIPIQAVRTEGQSRSKSEAGNSRGVRSQAPGHGQYQGSEYESCFRVQFIKQCPNQAKLKARSWGAKNNHGSHMKSTLLPEHFLKLPLGLYIVGSQSGAMEAEPCQTPSGGSSHGLCPQPVMGSGVHTGYW